MRNREEHIQWCKDRANEYLNEGEISQGVTSMLSDMGKHPETELDDVWKQLGFLTMMSKNLGEAKKFVNGFN